VFKNGMSGVYPDLCEPASSPTSQDKPLSRTADKAEYLQANGALRGGVAGESETARDRTNSVKDEVRSDESSHITSVTAVLSLVEPSIAPQKSNPQELCVEELCSEEIVTNNTQQSSVHEENTDKTTYDSGTGSQPGSVTGGKIESIVGSQADQVAGSLNDGLIRTKSDGNNNECEAPTDTIVNGNLSRTGRLMESVATSKTETAYASQARGGSATASGAEESLAIDKQLTKNSVCELERARTKNDGAGESNETSTVGASLSQTPPLLHPIEVFTYTLLSHAHSYPSLSAFPMRFYVVFYSA